MSIATEITRIIEAKEDIIVSIENKGVEVTAGSRMNDLPGFIDQISGGGGAPEASKPSDAFPIDSILAANVDSAGDQRVLMILRTDNSGYYIYPPFISSNRSKCSKVKTSDGSVYTPSNGTPPWSWAYTLHTFDASKDLIDNNGEKYRWIIYYFNSNNPIDILQPTMENNNPWAFVMCIITDGNAFGFSGSTSSSNRKILASIIHKNPDNIGNRDITCFSNNFLDNIIEYPTIIGSPSSYVKEHLLEYAKNQKIDTIYIANYNKTTSVYNQNIVSIRNLVPESTASTTSGPQEGRSGNINSTLESVEGTPTRNFLLGLKGSATEVVFKGQGLHITGFVPNSITHATNISGFYSLTRESLLSLINALSTTTTSTLTLGAQHIAKLSTAELQLIIDKGWSYA